MSPAPADLARRASVIRATSAPARRRAPNRHPEAAEQKARTRYYGSDHELVEALLDGLQLLLRLTNDSYGQRVLATQARAAKHDETPEARRQLALGANRVLADSWIDHLAGQNAPTDAQLDAHARTTYNANPNQFSQSEQLRARHILVAVNAGRDDAQAKARAEELLAQLRQGRPFDELAREASDDKGSGQRGGDLGTFGKGSMVPEFEAAAFALTKPGQLSEPVKSQFGYHVIELLERIPARRQTFEDVRAELREDARATLDGRTRKQSWDEAVRDVQVDSDAVQRLVRAPASTKP